MKRSRFQFGLTLLTGLFLLAVLFAILLYALTPQSPASRGPILLASFVAILIGSLLAILFLLRWLLRPYDKLVGEAERASVESRFVKSQDEAEFVLETFQSVVAQLQEQRKELERLSEQAAERIVISDCRTWFENVFKKELFTAERKSMLLRVKASYVDLV